MQGFRLQNHLFKFESSVAINILIRWNETRPYKFVQHFFFLHTPEELHSVQFVAAAHSVFRVNIQHGLQHFHEIGVPVRGVVKTSLALTENVLLRFKGAIFSLKLCKCLGKKLFGFNFQFLLSIFFEKKRSFLCKVLIDKNVLFILNHFDSKKSTTGRWYVIHQINKIF